MNNKVRTREDLDNKFKILRCLEIWEIAATVKIMAGFGYFAEWREEVLYGTAQPSNKLVSKDSNNNILFFNPSRFFD